MKTLRFFLAHSRRQLLATSVATVVSGLAMTALIIAINAHLREQQSASGMLAAAFFSMCLLIIGSRLLGGFLINKLMADSLYALRMRLARDILDVPLQQAEALGAAPVLAALTTDTQRINAAFSGLPFFLRSAIVLACCLIYMAVLSWQGFLIVTTFFAASIVLYRALSSIAVRHQRQARNEWDALYGHFRSLVQGIKEFQLHARKREDLLDTLIEPSEARYRQYTVAGNTGNSLAMSVGQTMSFVVIGLVFFVVPRLIAFDTQTMIAFTFLLIFMFGPLEALVSWLPQLMAADVAMDAIEKLGLSLKSQQHPAGQGAAALPEASAFSSLEVQGLTHSYEGEDQTRFTLGPLDLQIRAGELLFVVGGNGSGKTTFAKLLLGLYGPHDGVISVNGQLVDETDRSRYREYFSAVFADFHLTDRLLGLDAAQLARAEEWLARLQLGHKVRVENGAFSTTDLSQGQRKRLALLVACLEDRPVCLFDEVAADQDPHFKRVFYTEILTELRTRGKTVIVISHDDKYYGVADRLIKLESGRIVEAKDHSNMLRQEALTALA